MTCMNNSKMLEATTSLYPILIHFLDASLEGPGKLANNCPEFCACMHACMHKCVSAHVHQMLFSILTGLILIANTNRLSQR